MRRRALLTNLSLLMFAIPFLGSAAEKAPSADQLAEGEKRFEAYCGTCHSLDLPKSQRLDRANWAWVMDDMVNQYGATFLTAEDQRLIIDYLVSAYGPNR